MSQFVSVIEKEDILNVSGTFEKNVRSEALPYNVKVCPYKVKSMSI